MADYNSGNILGLSFDDEIKTQIETRQTQLNYRTNTSIKYENSKTAFVRMASSINLDPTGSNNVVQSLGLQDYDGNELAKRLILQGGVLDVDYQYNSSGQFLPSSSLNEGIVRDGSIVNHGAYGFGGNNFGYRPMPGIQDAQITSFNNGSIRKAEIKLKCFTPQQLHLVELLYMKVGYSILLEWGHTFYIDNQGKSQNMDTVWTKPFRKFIEGGDDVDQQKILSLLEYERKKYEGNYDAFFGIVNKFNYTFTQDGTYDVTINAMGIGSVMESLKCNLSTNAFNTLDTSKDDITKGDLVTNKIKSWANTIVAMLDNNDPFHDRKVSVQWPLPKQDAGMGRYLDFQSSYWSKEKISGQDEFEWKKKEYTLEKAAMSYNYLTMEGEWIEDGGWFYFDKDTRETTKATQYYVKLAYLLEFIEENLLLYEPAASGSELNPFMILERHPLKNLCNSIPMRWGTDPSVCMIPFYFNPDNDIFETATTTFVEVGNPFQQQQEDDAAAKQAARDAINNDPTKDVWQKRMEIEILDSEEEYQNTFMAAESTGVARNQPLNLNLSYNIQSANVYGLTPYVKEQLEYLKNTNTIMGNGFYTLPGNVKSDSLANIMHIHVNLAHCSSLLATYVDRKGKLSLHDFLKKLMDDINLSIGNVNNFSINYNNTENKMTIVENAYMKLGDIQDSITGKTGISKFVGYGSKFNRSFLKGFDFNVEISKEFGAMTAISAQANSNSVGENATALSTFNIGLKDRIWKEKKENIIDGGHELFNEIFDAPQPAKVQALKDLNKAYFGSDWQNNMMVSAYDIILHRLKLMYAPGLYIDEDEFETDRSDEDYNQADTEDLPVEDQNKRLLNQNQIEIVKSSSNTIFNHVFGQCGHYRQNNGKFFLPFVLNLKIDGLGGMKIFERFQVNDQMLPMQYQGIVDFMITGLDHNISNNIWTTSVKANTVNRDNDPPNPNRQKEKKAGTSNTWKAGYLMTPQAIFQGIKERLASRTRRANN